MARTPSNAAMTAKAVRAELKDRFSDVKFSVTSETYAGGDSVNIRWTDGPREADVAAVVSKFKAGTFNGMTDSYETTENNPLHHTVKFIDVERTLSPGMKAKLRTELADDAGLSEDATDDEIVQELGALSMRQAIFERSEVDTTTPREEVIEVLRNAMPKWPTEGRAGKRMAAEPVSINGWMWGCTEGVWTLQRINNPAEVVTAADYDDLPDRAAMADATPREEALAIVADAVEIWPENGGAGSVAKVPEALTGWMWAIGSDAEWYLVSMSGRTIELEQWVDATDARIEAIGQNGNDGQHYDEAALVQGEGEMKVAPLVLPTGEGKTSIEAVELKFTAAEQHQPDPIEPGQMVTLHNDQSERAMVAEVMHNGGCLLMSPLQGLRWWHSSELVQAPEDEQEDAPSGLPDLYAAAEDAIKALRSKECFAEAIALRKALMACAP